MWGDPVVEVGPKRDLGGRRKGQPNQIKPGMRGSDVGRNKKKERSVAAHSAPAAPSPTRLFWRKLILAESEDEMEPQVKEQGLANQAQTVAKGYMRRLVKAAIDPLPKGANDNHRKNYTEDEEDLLDPSSEDNAFRFEIKTRAPRKTTMPAPQRLKGRVQQVVVAFESGLHIKTGDDDQGNNAPASELVQGMKDWEEDNEGWEVGQLNEYGSNLVDPDFGSRKRPLSEVDGDLGDDPSSKKQFVEDDSDKVEVASQKWPQ
ncbi:unnamed protein product [Linum trigynum]|uniref:Uncharacterized protein n=1 Tax=Linum trigynum TaxID=586398 RepID=A0AAV2CHN0_9ROSI